VCVCVCVCLYAGVSMWVRRSWKWEYLAKTLEVDLGLHFDTPFLLLCTVFVFGALFCFCIQL